MKIISISKERFNQLEKLQLSKDVINTEGIIYDFNYSGENKILKKLYKLNENIFANKLYTLEMLDANKEYLPSSFCIPDYLCTVNSEIVGFTIPKIEGTNLYTILNSKDIDYKGQIYYLKKIGEILNQLHNIRKYTPLKDIYINDLHEFNFMVDNQNRELKVIDLDSCKIGENKSSPAAFLTPYSLISKIEKYKINDNKKEGGYINPDSNTDIYCYCVIILNYLYGDKVGSIGLDNFYEYLNYLEYIKVNKNLLDCFKKTISNYKNENPINYLDSLTSEQISRAKKVVYTKVKKADNF